MSRVPRSIVGATVTLVVLALVGVGTLYSGWYDVAATEEHSSATRWVLGTLQRRSVRARAGELEEPLPTDSSTLAHGFAHYEEMCVTCHGAPGVERGELGKGMAPTPPDLAEEAGEWTDAELVWITEHGIKLAGMPGFGPTHSDAEIRATAAFVRRLPEMSADDYARYAAARAEAPDSAGAGHTHGGEGHTHEDGGHDL